MHQLNVDFGRFSDDVKSVKLYILGTFAIFSSICSKKLPGASKGRLLSSGRTAVASQQTARQQVFDGPFPDHFLTICHTH